MKRKEYVMDEQNKIPADEKINEAPGEKIEKASTDNVQNTEEISADPTADKTEASPEKAPQQIAEQDVNDSDNENKYEYKIGRREYIPVSGNDEYSRWSYTEQASKDRKSTKKGGAKNALIFTAVMSSAFTIAILALILSLVLGGVLYKPEKIIYKDRVVYVREDGTTSGSLSVPEIYQKLDPSIVFINVGSGTGTGIIMSEDGYVLTNAHVVKDAQSITITLNDNTTYTAALCGIDEIADVAVIKVDPRSPLTPAEFGSSDEVIVGESVVAIGCPAGYSGTITNGIISAVDREIEITDSDGRVEKTMTLIQTNTNINPGNSGGALIDMDGKVIGITTLKLVESGSGISYEGLGFAIPITPALKIAEILKTGGESYGGDVATKIPTLGVTGTFVTQGQQNGAGGAFPATGFLISAVAEGSSADGVIKIGDILLSADNKMVIDINVVKDILKTKKAGDTMTFVVYRDDTRVTLTVTLK